MYIWYIYVYVYVYMYIHVYILCIVPRRRRSALAIPGSFSLVKPTMVQVVRSSWRWMGTSGKSTRVRASTMASTPLWWSGGWIEWTRMHRVSHLRSWTRHRMLIPRSHPWLCCKLCAAGFKLKEVLPPQLEAAARASMYTRGAVYASFRVWTRGGSYYQ